MQRPHNQRLTSQRESHWRDNLVLVLGILFMGAIATSWWQGSPDEQAPEADVKPAQDDEQSVTPLQDHNVAALPRTKKQTGRISMESSNEAIWDTFQQERLPRFVQQFQALLGTDHPIEIDWTSLGVEHNNDEHLSYDLEMLHRTLSRDKRYEVAGYELEAKRLRQGIARIHLRRVRQMEKRRLEVIDGTLEIDLFWGRLGNFTPDDIRTLLADRQRAQLSTWLNAPNSPLSPLMAEALHNRLPRLYRELEKVLGHPIPLHVDWEGLVVHPDAPYRLVYILDELIEALSELARSESATVGMRRSPLAQQRIDERRAIVINRIQTLRIRGGSYTSDPVLHFDDKSLELIVYLDSELDESPASAGAERQPLYQMKRLSSCKKSTLLNTLTDQLDLEVGPFLRQLQTVHFPRTQSYFQQYLDTLIGKTRFSAPERVTLRELLTTKGISLEVDWDSFTTPGDREAKLRVMAMMEAEDDSDNYGELFANLFHALDEVARTDTQSLKVFFARIRTLRFEQVTDPAGKELVREEKTLIIRQSLLHPGGMIPFDKLATKIIIALASMGDKPQTEQHRSPEGLEPCLAELRNLLGENGQVHVEEALASDPEAAGRTCRRMVTPLVDAWHYLKKQPGYHSILMREVQSVRLTHVTSPAEINLSFTEGALALSCSPEYGTSGCLSADNMARAIEKSVALRDKYDIADIERSNRSFWIRILRERFDRDIDVEVNWNAFLADAALSDKPLSPLNIQQAGLERLLYAVTGWMDDDEAFRAEAMVRIDSLYVTSARGMEGKGITLKDGQIVYRCYAGDWAGYYSIDEIQQQLGRLIPRKSRARKMLEGWMNKLFTPAENPTDTQHTPEVTPQEQPPVDNYPEAVSEQDETAASPSITPRKTISAEEIDPVLRGELEPVYEKFRKAVEQRNLDALLRQLSLSKSDEEVLHREMASDGFASFAEWLLSVYPPLEKATLVSLRTVDDDFAGYYMVWVPSYSHDHLNLTLRTFIREEAQWKLRFQISDNSTAIFRVLKDEQSLAKVREVIATSPLLRLERPQVTRVPQEWLHPATLSATESQIKKALETIIQSHYRTLNESNFKQFIAPLILYPENKEQLSHKFNKHAKQLLLVTPEPSASTFVKLQLLGEGLAGYYFVASYPLNPSFDFVYLEVFVKRGENWKMLFDPDNKLAMNLSAAKSDGDQVSRALELIHDIDLLQLKWVVSSLYDELITRGVDADGVSQNDRHLAAATAAIAREEYSIALELLPPLAEAGNAIAQSQLGLLYAEGLGIEADYNTSLPLFTRSAKQGEPDGLYYLGYSYLHGTGVDIDRSRALAYFILAAQMGHKAAIEEVNRAEAVLSKQQQKNAMEIALEFRIEKQE